jgi:tetratricopeptide (TPR) repeat protein
VRKIFFLCAAALLLAAFRPATGQETAYFSAENILRFADYLYEEKDYVRAAAEYRRYLSYGDVPPSAAAPIYFKIGLCYRLTQDYPKSITAFQTVIEKFPRSKAAEDSYIQVAYGHFLGGRYDESLSFADVFSFKFGSDENRIELSLSEELAKSRGSSPLPE